MAKTEKSLKSQKIIEKLININNIIEVEDTDAMGQDVFIKLTVKYDPKTSIDEIDDDYIDRHNQIHGGHFERIEYGVKYYGTVYIKVVKIEEFYLDDENEEQVITNIYPQRDDVNFSLEMNIFDEIITRLYKFLPDTLYNIDIDFNYK